MLQWSEVDTYLIDEAADDLIGQDMVTPCLLAFRGDESLFCAYFRSFAKGEYADPLIELLAVAAPLGADRLALSMSARAWSWEDPIPPVVEGLGDLRQRVVLIHRVDGSSKAAVLSCALHPYEIHGDQVRWGDVISQPGEIEGWIGGALTLAVDRRHEMATTDDAIRRQARRCAQLGHLIGWDARTADRLGLDTAEFSPSVIRGTLDVPRDRKGTM